MDRLCTPSPTSGQPGHDRFVHQRPAIRYPLSLRQVEDLLFERGIDICHETVRLWWNRFGPLFAAEIRKRRVHHRSYSNWRWHLDEVFARINGKTHCLCRAVDHEGKVLEAFATKRRDRKAALKFLKRTMKRDGRPWSIVTDRLRSIPRGDGALQRHQDPIETRRRSRLDLQPLQSRSSSQSPPHLQTKPLGCAGRVVPAGRVVC
jgi:transposase-like protein